MFCVFDIEKNEVVFTGSYEDCLRKKDGWNHTILPARKWLGK